ncbi:acyltransferase family protein [Paenibacillus sp. y28]|uniref:acyltransferase family protein n=1 Tax=Paenibacillus sp. y28 TaxID=3129110 RepID=UPI00301B0A37
MEQRFKQADALRGLAALTVMLCSIFLIFPVFFARTQGQSGFLLLNLLKHSPISLIWSAHSAVILFFVLSGFVLALPFTDRLGEQRYVPFLFKRICRIYIPYIAVVLLAMSASMIIPRIDYAPDMSVWFHSQWRIPVTMEALFAHLLLIGQFDTDAFQYTIWSLVHEMRISIIFPFLMVIVMRLNWKFNLLLALFCSGLGHAGKYVLFHLYGNPTPPLSSFHATIHYIALFIIGALLAKHRTGLISFYQKLGRPVHVALLLAAVLLYTYDTWFLPSVGRLHMWIVNDWAIAAGSFLLLWWAIASKSSAQAGLVWRSLQGLGRISYSLYLVHPVLLLTMTRLLYGLLPLWLNVILGAAAALGVSVLLHRFVELPAMQLGRQVERQLNRRDYARLTEPDIAGK